MKALLEQANGWQEELVQWRREIHRFAEVGTHLPRTKAFVTQTLRELGYAPEEICESGIVAVLEGNPGGKTMLLRADMDALPVQEATNVDFRAENGNMHACGHDMHAAMLLGAARLLMENRNRLNGTVKLVFQPDEEGLTGGRAMVDAGVLESPAVDGALAVHVHSGTPTGQVLCGIGPCMAGASFFRITVKGVGCHGAMPETGVDPINIAAHIYFALQEVIAREVCPTSAAAITIGKFMGGEVPNRIPHEVIMEGSARSLDQKVLERLCRRIGEVADYTARAFGGTAEVTTLSSVPALVNDGAMVEELTGYVKELMPDRPPHTYSGGGMGSDDFAAFIQTLPGVYLLLGAGAAEEDERYGKPMHNESIFFNEEILPVGAAIYAGCAIKWLEDHK